MFVSIVLGYLVLSVSGVLIYVGYTIVKDFAKNFHDNAWKTLIALSIFIPSVFLCWAVGTYIRYLFGWETMP